MKCLIWTNQSDLHSFLCPAGHLCIVSKQLRSPSCSAHWKYSCPMRLLHYCLEPVEKKVVHPVASFNLDSVDHSDESSTDLIYSPPPLLHSWTKPLHSSLVPPITVPLSIHFSMKWSVYILLTDGHNSTCEGNKKILAAVLSANLACAFLLSWQTIPVCISHVVLSHG